jgi:hypothetical protein
MKTSSPPSQHVILSVNYSVGGVEYPAGRPVPRDLVQPHHLSEYEVRPDAPRKRRASGTANFVPGVSYPIGPDGPPIRTEETDAAEERAFKVRREIEEESWRHSGLRFSDPETGEIVEPEKLS